MYNNSDLQLLDGEVVLLIWTRSMEVINFAFFLITIRIIQTHSSPSFGSYKYCIYQIVIMSLVSQVISIFGPVFCMPILGGYVTVELFVSPFALHFLFSLWICMTLLDIESIMDGFNYRCRVLLKTFHPQFTNKFFWIGISIFAKSATVTIISAVFLPLGFRLDKTEMRGYIEKNFPNVLPTFDDHKSFFVYDPDLLMGEPILLISFILGIFLICGDCFLAILIVFGLLHFHQSKMSSTTRKMHVRFLIQLVLQALVPVLVVVAPALTLVLLLFVQIPLKTNLCGYIILFLMMMHGPLTSIMTIALYDPYRKAVRKFFSHQKKTNNIGITVESRASVTIS